MADGKRQSIAGKIATPKVGPSKEGSFDGESILYKAVGARYVSLALPSWASFWIDLSGLDCV